MFGVAAGSVEAFDFNSSDNLRFYTIGGSGALLASTAVFRDTSAWMHLVLSVDTTQATASNRTKIYVNGAQITQFGSSTYPAQNYDTFINNNNIHYIGDRGAGSQPFDGYLADIHFIDGQALDPTSFGEFSATTGVWMPKAYTGTYGTNGFHLDFSNNASAAALGTDSSGQGNTWSVNNLSVTAGAGNDSLVDVPTNGSEVDTGSGGQVRGNYCTLNPLDKSSSVDLSNGNLTNVGTTTNVMCRSTIFVSSGKWYYEVTLATYSGNPIFGWASSSANLASWVGNSTSSWGYAANAMKYSNGGGSSYGASFGAGDVVGVAADLDAGTLVFYKNGVSQGTAYSNLSGALCPAFSSGASTTVDFNFGQRPFAYTAPSGFKALCTANLPAPVVTKPSTVMDVKLYTGNGSTQTISGLNMSPDLVWIKSRDEANTHNLYDIVRGTGKELVSNTTAAEASYGNSLTSFDSTGFSLGNASWMNGSSKSYVAWTWDAGSSTVTNTQGSITSRVRANASAGFSIVTFTMGSGSFTVGHGLGVAPTLLITKARSNSSSWWTYHTSLGTGSYLALNSTAAAASDYSWGSAPTSTVFTANNNFFTNGYTYVVYAFAPVAGYSSFGSYTGNGSADGPFVYTGFRPRWILWKCTTAAYDWDVYDAVRDPYNAAAARLKPNSSDAEATLSPATFDILSNGFKLRQGYNSSNASGQIYIYFAVAESPFQYARAR
jgi:hypothetical protein